MPEFYDDEVARGDRVGEGCEAAFVGVGACAAACNCVVDYGEGEGVGEVDAPAWKGWDVSLGVFREL